MKMGRHEEFYRFFKSLPFFPRNLLEFTMEAKSPSDPSPVLAQQKHSSDHPLGRILEPLGFYGHPILYTPSSNRPMLAANPPPWRFTLCLFAFIFFYLLSFVVNTVMRIHVVITART